MGTKTNDLIRELETSEGLRVGNLRIPTEEAVEALGRTRDPAAIPALEEALKEAIKFKEMGEDLQKKVNPFAEGSASPLLAAALAGQVIEKIRQAIRDCSSS